VRRVEWQIGYRQDTIASSDNRPYTLLWTTIDGWCFLFADSSLVMVLFMAMIMLFAAGREVLARQNIRLKGVIGYVIGTGAMFISSFSVSFLALVVIIGVDPWYTPQYAIPLFGMLLGNTMTGTSISYSNKKRKEVVPKKSGAENGKKNCHCWWGCSRA